MKREMKRRVAQQSRCMAAMMVHLNVDAMAASREGMWRGVRGSDFPMPYVRSLKRVRRMVCRSEQG